MLPLDRGRYAPRPASALPAPAAHRWSRSGSTIRSRPGGTRAAPEPARHGGASGSWNVAAIPMSVAFSKFDLLRAGGLDPGAVAFLDPAAHPYAPVCQPLGLHVRPRERCAHVVSISSPSAHQTNAGRNSHRSCRRSRELTQPGPRPVKSGPAPPRAPPRSLPPGWHNTDRPKGQAWLRVPLARRPEVPPRRPCPRPARKPVHSHLPAFPGATERPAPSPIK